MWKGVTARFRTFHQNLHLTENQLQEGSDHHHGVRRCLNAHYYELLSDTANSFLIGSWGKFTKTCPPRDIDLYFVLPDDVFLRFQNVTGNKHSALLQEVKRVLKSTFPNTEMRGDGQVVVVGFARINVEVVPAFTFPNGQYLICDTHNGGSYKFADPKAEMRFIAELHEQYVGNLRPLIMMMKAWQETCDVPIKSFWLELVAADFLRQYRYADKNYFWYDWMMRDFFAYLYNRAGSWVFVPGTGEAIFLGDKWRSRALTAYNHAVEACDNEYHDYVYLAGQEWQKIFGSQIPKS